jgi:hypothetical protein
MRSAGRKPECRNVRAAHWRKRAEEARKLAEQMDGDAKRSSLTIATEYDKLTERADKREQKAKGGLREG